MTICSQRRLVHQSVLTASSLHAKVQPALPRACQMERPIAPSITALDTRTHSLVADVAQQFPSAWRNLFDIGDGLHQRRIAYLYFGNPDSTEKVGPFCVVRLLESAAFMRTENAAWTRVANKLALPTQPLPFRNVGNSIALLVHSQVAAIAENDRVRILAVAIVANSTLSIAFLPSWLTINSCSRARAWPLGLRRLRIRLWNSLL